MNFLDWLRRLGILRFGSEAGVYHNARERPLSLQMDDVFEPRKDVIDLTPLADRKTPPPPERRASGRPV
jgi:hypothetical protein